MTLPIWMLTRAALVIALALLAMPLLRRFSASLRHAVLGAALAAALVMPALEAVAPTWHARTATAAVVEPPALPVAEPTGGPSPTSAHATPAPEPPAPFPWPAIAGGLWLAGIALGVGRVVAGAMRARAIAARGVVVPERGVVVSDEIEAPIVVGAFAPVIVVPRSSSGWDAERWRVVLLHELAHVHRRDGLANLVAQLACCLHWCNPLVWLAARRLRIERELAADDAVLTDGTRASTYAEHLLAIATGEVPAAALAMAEPSRLEARVAALLDDRARNAIGMRRALAVAGAIGAIAIVAACVSAEPSSPAAKDTALQAAAEAELDRGMAANHASGAIAIVLDAKTGAPLAIATRGNGDAHAPRTPGSTMKPFTIAAALEAGVVERDARIDCENGTRAYGDRKLRDASANGVLDLGGILAVSSNVCTAKLAEPLGDKLGDALRRYHLAAPAHIDTRSLDGASIASGEGLRVPPLDVASGYTAFADGGTYHAPDGSSERVMSADTAHAMMDMLARVVDDADGTGHAARIDGVRVAGKTGTAVTGVEDRYYASFVGIVPVDAPRFIVLVGFDGVAGAGGKVAAPVFAKIAARALGMEH